MNKRRYGLASESGQALVEYILILVVVIGLALLLMNKFFKPMQRWTDHYLGGYVVCLLDQGKLPGQLEDCPYDETFAGDSTSNSGSKSSSNSNTNKDSETAADSEGRGSSPSDRRSPGEKEQSTNGGRMRRVRVGGTDGAAGASGKNTVAEAETRASRNQAFFRARGPAAGARVGQGQRQQVYGLSGLLQSERDKIKKREEKVQKAVAVVSDEGGAGGKKKFEFNPSVKRAVAQDVGMDEWSFGKLFRILLILVIVIALVLVIGGQLVQITKGMEK